MLSPKSLSQTLLAALLAVLLIAPVAVQGSGPFLAMATPVSGSSPLAPTDPRSEEERSESSDAFLDFTSACRRSLRSSRRHAAQVIETVRSTSDPRFLSRQGRFAGRSGEGFSGQFEQRNGVGAYLRC